MNPTVKDGKAGVQILEPSGNIIFEEVEPLPECLQNIANAFVSYKDGIPLHKMLQDDFNLHSMAILDAGLRLADSGKMELVNNATWKIG